MSKDRKPAPETPGPILPPGTRLVDSPDWDRAAPNLEIVLDPKRKVAAPAPEPPKPGGAAVPRTTAIALMIGVGLAIVAGAGFGLWKLLDANRDTESAALAETQTEAGVETGAVSAVEVEPAPVTQQELETLYRGHVLETAVALDLDPLTIEELRQPNAFSHPISYGSPKIIAPGSSKRIGPLTFKVRVDTLSLERRGIISKGRHTTLVVTNNGEQPLAYRLFMRKAEGGECKSPVVFNYDAMVIDPGQTFDISVCGGSHSVEVIDLRMLEITALGAAWVRQVPPEVVGLLGMAARAHDPGPDVIACKEDAAEIVRALDEHLVDWEDVIDFYSRHDCQHYPWPSEYRLATEALPSLPIRPAPQP
ncbi:hypothetical protein ENSA5_09880 [Enhygromyxa salina]|uniref:Uncharacterized protein n=1 Tax=Enhygromyxa salina TaxID=215803 RepID=A0A2S9YGG9_9BACT|nr:hypothetical protein [Enhygromyxa salina]PRQ04204.1 hypothetical protein ENSA5_09880 [Enhygromyxa salina]